MKSIHFGFNNTDVGELKKFNIVKNMFLNNSNLKSIPKLCLKNSIVKYLFLFNNSISEVRKESFQGILKLEVLSLAYNKIKFLGGKSIPDAKIVHLNNNLIKVINQKMFVNILRLKQLSLHCNNLRILQATMEKYVGTKIVLDYNKIDYLESMSIPASSEVYLKNNALTSIHAKHFVNITVIEVLELSWNNIIYVSNNSFLGSQLKTLRLDYNKILTIDQFCYMQQQSQFLN
ncbi:PREDICTED: leucine-rich repeat-containing protein 70-like [Nicrophorus vespilloides]|uniref:Leucine-rich repeat-containing protein 70-like n=1 Tax=Nicrophorus vespilloides TaxID=110193 RepID=A0ABM1N7S4_NICVS|nr:PREDICTED: leucine-rich repeat-containing protein 70-like [Nicrophorus vespilloides]